MNNLALLYPEIFLSGLALLLLVADLLMPYRHSKVLYHLGIFSAVIALGVVGWAYSDPSHLQGTGTLWVVGPLALFFKVIILVTTILALLVTVDYMPGSASQPPSFRHLGSFTALVLFASTGLMLLVSATDLLLVFLSLELVSISSFVLAGFERHNVRSSEGAMKYFLIGSFSAAIMLFGISLYYGATGTTHFPLAAGMQRGALGTLGLLLVLVGFGFKASIVPFHLWVPDAYEGAPTPVTAYLSVAPKLAALGLMLVVFTYAFPLSGSMLMLFALLAALTMTVGNLTAIFQNNVKRLLAYSSIAQAGYMLLGFVAADSLGRDGVLLYALAYVFMNIGAFTVAIMVGNANSYELEAYDGLAQRNFPVALLMAFFLLSLAGIPPTAGFIAKFYIFGSLISAKWYWLAVIGVLNSVVSVYYYLKIAYHMFFMDTSQVAEPLDADIHLYTGLVVAAAGIFLIGLYPDPFITAARASAKLMPTSTAQAPAETPNHLASAALAPSPLP